MNRATKTTIVTFGILAVVAGLEHGTGEVLQGSQAPGGLVFLSWPDSPFFRILGGEPAMSLIPNLLVTGILAILVSLLFLVWVVRYPDHRYGGPVLLLLSVLWLLVGGGFGPPLLGIILGLAAWATRLPQVAGAPRQAGPRRFFGRLWPYLFAVSLLAWLLLFPGTNVLDYFLRVSLPDAGVFAVIAVAFAGLILAILCSFSHEGRWLQGEP